MFESERSNKSTPFASKNKEIDIEKRKKQDEDYRQERVNNRKLMNMRLDLSMLTVLKMVLMRMITSLKKTTMTLIL